VTYGSPKTHTSVAETVGAQGRAPTSRRDALPACLGNAGVRLRATHHAH